MTTWICRKKEKEEPGKTPSFWGVVTIWIVVPSKKSEKGSQLQTYYASGMKTSTSHL
jgi:hypothetical protein